MGKSRLVRSPPLKPGRLTFISSPSSCEVMPTTAITTSALLPPPRHRPADWSITAARPGAPTCRGRESARSRTCRRASFLKRHLALSWAALRGLVDRVVDDQLAVQPQFGVGRGQADLDRCRLPAGVSEPVPAGRQVPRRIAASLPRCRDIEVALASICVAERRTGKSSRARNIPPSRLAGRPASSAPKPAPPRGCAQEIGAGLISRLCARERRPLMPSSAVTGMAGLAVVIAQQHRHLVGQRPDDQRCAS